MPDLGKNWPEDDFGKDDGPGKDCWLEGACAIGEIWGDGGQNGAVARTECA